jgi:hypothetical protein
MSVFVKGCYFLQISCKQQKELPDGWTKVDSKYDTSDLKEITLEQAIMLHKDPAYDYAICPEDPLETI